MCCSNVKLDIHVGNNTNKCWKVVNVVKNAKQWISKDRDIMIMSLVEGQYKSNKCGVFFVT